MVDYVYINARTAWFFSYRSRILRARHEYLQESGNELLPEMRELVQRRFDDQLFYFLDEIDRRLRPTSEHAMVIFHNQYLADEMHAVEQESQRHLYDNESDGDERGTPGPAGTPALEPSVSVANSVGGNSIAAAEAAVDSTVDGVDDQTVDVQYY